MAQTPDGGCSGLAAVAVVLVRALDSESAILIARKLWLAPNMLRPLVPTLHHHKLQIRYFQRYTASIRSPWRIWCVQIVHLRPRQRLFAKRWMCDPGRVTWSHAPSCPSSLTLPCHSPPSCPSSLTLPCHITRLYYRPLASTAHYQPKWLRIANEKWQRMRSMIDG